MTQPTVSKTSILSVMSPWSHLARVTGGVVSTAVKGHLWPSHSLTCSSGWWHIWRPRNSPWGSGAECPSSSGSAVPYRWSLNGGTERREVSGGEESGWKERLRESEEKMSGEREYRKMRRDERGGGYNREEESLKSIVEAIGFSSQKNPCRTQWFHPTIVRVSHISVTHTLDSRKDSKLQFSEKGKKKNITRQRPHTFQRRNILCIHPSQCPTDYRNLHINTRTHTLGVLREEWVRKADVTG